MIELHHGIKCHLKKLTNNFTPNNQMVQIGPPPPQ